MAAYTLACHGKSALLLEKSKLPRYKVCGGGLVYRARQGVPFDITPVIEREFNSIDWKLDKDLKFSVARDFPLVTMVMRDTFDELLLRNAYEAGAEIHDEESFVSFRQDSNTIRIKTSVASYHARYVIAADGVLSPVFRYSGLKDQRTKIPAVEAEITLKASSHPLYEKVLFDVTAIPHGYGWVFPKGEHLSIGVAAMPSSKASINNAYKKFLETLEISEIAEVRKYGFQIPLFPHRQLSQGNILFTGDAAGLADPLVAEGISHALFSGTGAGKALIQQEIPPADYYENYIKKELRNQIRAARFLSRLFYDHPALTRRIMQRKGQYISEYVSDIFAGKRRYPENFNMVSRSILKLL
jgi:geranylgeranyl reductase family protein